MENLSRSVPLYGVDLAQRDCVVEVIASSPMPAKETTQNATVPGSPGFDYSPDEGNEKTQIQYDIDQWCIPKLTNQSTFDKACAYQRHTRQLVRNIKPDDVLSGRGGATNSHSGNRAFRSLVKSHQDQYLQAKKKDKPAVASMIVDSIRRKGGRFLRRYKTTSYGEVVWIDIGNDRAREKTCQALREGAPEIRKKRKVSSTRKREAKQNSNDLEDDSSEADVNPAAIAERNRRPFFCRAWDSDYTRTQSLQPMTTNDNLSQVESIIFPCSDYTAMYRFWHPIRIDDLNPAEKEIYARDFFPPNAATERSYFRTDFHVHYCQEKSTCPVVQV